MFFCEAAPEEAQHHVRVDPGLSSAPRQGVQEEVLREGASKSSAVKGTGVVIPCDRR